MKEIIRAEHSGFCFGVRQAVDNTFKLLRENKGIKIYSKGQLIHNRDVTDELEKSGIKVISGIEEAEPGSIVVIRSHGETEKFYDDAAKHGVKIMDATCPFVKRIHKLVHEAHEKGRKIVIAGDRNHPEVTGINGWCGDSAYIVNSREEALGIEGEGFFLVAQTTIRKELFDEVEEVLSGRDLVA
ncbi:MAG: 4-hydroxy-3-methylbut-2-enyl diphosphate reductase, partial [Clostridiales bacterium]|nr:4-hydroxy-3-methylbut-2-enyl diphosphate reductase [Clostridiales bacterium]